MRQSLVMLVATLFSCFAAEAQNTNRLPTEDGVRLRVAVEDSVPLMSFQGAVTPTGDVNPMFALTLRIISCVPAITNLKSGTVVTFAVHSPSRFLAGTAEKGKTNEITLPWNKSGNLALGDSEPPNGWKTVDEGFLMTVPESWQKHKVRCYDSNCGVYSAETADLEFDEVFDLGYTTEKSQKQIDKLKNKQMNPELLEQGEEIWHVDGRIARFSVGKVHSAEYGERRFSNVAKLHVPYSGKPAYLSVDIFYRSDKDLPTVRKVLRSIKWK